MEQIRATPPHRLDLFAEGDWNVSPWRRGRFFRVAPNAVAGGLKSIGPRVIMRRKFLRHAGDRDMLRQWAKLRAEME